MYLLAKLHCTYMYKQMKKHNTRLCKFRVGKVTSFKLLQKALLLMMTYSISDAAAL